MSNITSHRPEAVIVPFDPADAHELACVAVQAYADTYGHKLPKGGSVEVVESGAWVQQFEESAQVDSILVAKLGGAIVGYAQFGGPGSYEASIWPRSAELRKLYVARDMQKRGIGQQLMDAALASPALVTVPQIYLWVWGGNPKAIRFYERHYNFRKVGYRPYTDASGNPTCDFIMLREQTPTL